LRADQEVRHHTTGVNEAKAFTFAVSTAMVSAAKKRKLEALVNDVDSVGDAKAVAEIVQVRDSD
jgi:hypothetical protein